MNCKVYDSPAEYCETHGLLFLENHLCKIGDLEEKLRVSIETLKSIRHNTGRQGCYEHYECSIDRHAGMCPLYSNAIAEQALQKIDTEKESL